MNTAPRRIVAHFADAEAFLAAIGRLKAEGFVRLNTFSPIPLHAIETQLKKGPSPVRFFTLAGVLFGGITAWLLTMFASLQYPFITGGKPIISIPPFLVVIFELMILFGALGTILGMLVHIRLPRFRAESGYDPAFSVDRFGIRLRCPIDRVEAVKALLSEAEALRDEAL